MKKILFISCIYLIIGCDYADEQDYSNLATDLCNCLNEVDIYDEKGMDDYRC